MTRGISRCFLGGVTWLFEVATADTDAVEGILQSELFGDAIIICSSEAFSFSSIGGWLITEITASTFIGGLLSVDFFLKNTAMDGCPDGGPCFILTVRLLPGGLESAREMEISIIRTFRLQSLH